MAPVLVSRETLGNQSRLLESYFYRVGQSMAGLSYEQKLLMLRQTRWEMIEDELFLIQMDGRDPAAIPELADAELGPGTSVRADWVSGILCRAPVVTANLGPLVGIWRGRIMFREALAAPGKQRQIELSGKLAHMFAPDELGFVHLLAADRNDRTTRLIYADWLEERQDPRSALLRLDHTMRLVASTGPHADRMIGLQSTLIAQIENWVWLWLAGFELGRKRREELRL